jgi:hypothetical protein
MRHLTISTALVAGCLIAGASWAQGSSGSSSGGGSSGGSSSSASPSTGSSSGTGAQPSNSTIRPPGQVAPGNTGVRGTPDLTGNGTNQDSSAVGNAARGNPGSPPGNEASTGGAATSANRSSTDPNTTGGVGGVNRLQPGERSAVGPSNREEELFRKGEQLEQKAREDICSTC